MPGNFSAWRLCRFLLREGTQLALRQAEIEMKEALLEEKHWQEEGKVVEAEWRQEAEASGLAESTSKVDNEWETNSEAGDEEDGGDGEEL